MAGVVIVYEAVSQEDAGAALADFLTSRIELDGACVELSDPRWEEPAFAAYDAVVLVGDAGSRQSLLAVAASPHLLDKPVLLAQVAADDSAVDPGGHERSMRAVIVAAGARPLVHSISVTPAEVRRNGCGVELSTAGRTAVRAALHELWELLDEEPATDPDLVTAADAGRLQAAGALVIDVRKAATRSSAGFIDGAEIVEKTDVEAAFGRDPDARFAALDPATAAVVVVCASVAGSGPVVATLRRLGWTGAVHVEGGFPAWQAAGLPVTATDGPR